MRRYFLLDELATNIKRTLMWGEIFDVRNIKIISETLANNEIAMLLLKIYKPRLYNIDIIYPQKVASILLKRNLENDTLFIFESMDDIVELIFKGFNPRDIYIGRMQSFGIRKRLWENIYLSPIDYKRLVLIQLAGVNIYFDAIRKAPLREIEGVIRKIIFE
ncbi:MAG: PTS sugar transporter subunit IIB [bacterium]